MMQGDGIQFMPIGRVKVRKSKRAEVATKEITDAIKTLLLVCLTGGIAGAGFGIGGMLATVLIN